MNKTPELPNGAPDSNGFLARMDQEFSGWNDPSARILQALAEDEFVLYAQPVLALRDAPQFALAEVLVRLREEEVAMLPPGDFFPVFEQFGMMPQLDRWVARHAIGRLVRGSMVPQLSINVSAQTLGDAEFPDAVAAELARTRMDPGRLCFEIDESDVLARPALVVRFADSMKRVGCRILIDGFGRRAVSLAPLKELRVDYVKVDGTIVRNLHTSETARGKLKVVVRVGDAIGVGVIVECVEDGDNLEQAKRAGAGYAQGFGIKRPAPLDAVAEGEF